VKYESQPSPVPGSRRGRPGRPRKGDLGIFGGSQFGHILGTVSPEQQSRSEEKGGTSVRLTIVPCHPRLLNLHDAAIYLGLSQFTVRELEQQGVLSRVRIPLRNHGELRKVLLDKADLDRLIEAWKEGPNNDEVL